MPAAASLLTLAAVLFASAQAHALSEDPATTAGQGTLVVEELHGSTLKHLQDLAPGDRTEWAAQVTNTGHESTAVTVLIHATGTDPLIRDTVEGLQLEVDLCPGALDTHTTGNGARQFTCRTGETRLGAGPAAQLAADPAGLSTRTELGSGKTMAVRVRVALPAHAGNNLENTQGELSVRVTPTGTTPGSGNPTTPGHPTTPAGPGGTGTGSDTAEPPTATVPHEDLPVTGRDILAALAGALITTAIGALLFVTSRRRRRPIEEQNP